jgi:hypothetical protein
VKQAMEASLRLRGLFVEAFFRGPVRVVGGKYDGCIGELTHWDNEHRAYVTIRQNGAIFAHAVSPDGLRRLQ